MGGSKRAENVLVQKFSTIAIDFPFLHVGRNNAIESKDLI